MMNSVAFGHTYSPAVKTHFAHTAVGRSYPSKAAFVQFGVRPEGPTPKNKLFETKRARNERLEGRCGLYVFGGVAVVSILASLFMSNC